MADNKYGRVFTEDDVMSIILEVLRRDYGQEDIANFIDDDLAEIIKEMGESGFRFKFDADEPLFVLRGHDKRAVGAIKHYAEHQSPRAPVNHLDAIDKALQAFIDYREANPGKLKEPD